MKQITEIDDPRLVKGLAHPLRIAILRVLEHRIASPREIAEEINAPLGNVSYHVRFLVRVGLIELSETVPRRGSVEHYYRAVSGVELSEELWAQVPRPVRDAALAGPLGQIGSAVRAAALAGGFSHEQAQLARLEMVLDATGFSELSTAVAELLRAATRIERESADRIAAAGSELAPRASEGAGPSELVLLLYDAFPAGADRAPVDIDTTLPP